MRFSIVTASFRQFGWLKRCARSIADQTGVEFEHIIQDAGTGPELEAWVAAHTRARLYVEKDEGMYDAINRGLDRATGDILAFLNCDEQYLPGTLQAVAETFAAHPEADIVVGDFLVLDPASQLLAFRKVTKLRRIYIANDQLYAFTCATFFRRRVWDSGIRYRQDLKAVADGQWMYQALTKGFRPHNLRRYLSIYTHTGENLGRGDVAQAERQKWLDGRPWWEKLVRPFLPRMRHFERFLAGGYRSKPLTYEVYTSDDAETRTRIVVEKPSATW
jgi:glycosyltransferase involved in cell wall biosynthesis